MLGFQKVTVEMLIPDSIDLSDLLEQVQDLAADLAEDVTDEGIDLDILQDKIRDEVSVYRSPLGE